MLVKYSAMSGIHIEHVLDNFHPSDQSGRTVATDPNHVILEPTLSLPSRLVNFLRLHTYWKGFTAGLQLFTLISLTILIVVGIRGARPWSYLYIGLVILIVTLAVDCWVRFYETRHTLTDKGRIYKDFLSGFRSGCLLAAILFIALGTSGLGGKSHLGKKKWYYHTAGSTQMMISLSLLTALTTAELVAHIWIELRSA